MTNTEKLKQRIRDSGYKLGYIAEKVGLSRYGLYLKINNNNGFTINEVTALCDLLGIDTLEEKEEIFFAKQVDEIAT